MHGIGIFLNVPLYMYFHFHCVKQRLKIVDLSLNFQLFLKYLSWRVSNVYFKKKKKAFDYKYTLIIVSRFRSEFFMRYVLFCERKLDNMRLMCVFNYYSSFLSMCKLKHSVACVRRLFAIYMELAAHVHYDSMPM